MTGSGTRGRYRGRTRSAALLVAGGIAGLFAPACTRDAALAVGSPGDRPVGLFTPGYKVEATTASGATATAGGGADSQVAGPVCQGTNTTWVDDEDAGGVPADCLTLEFATDGPVGHYDKQPGQHENIGTVWIEDAEGGYVKGLESWAGVYGPKGQYDWLVTRHRFGCPDPDIVTSATLHMHQMHHSTWKCQDTMNRLVRDGNYVLWIDVQVDEQHPQALVQIPFVKGRQGYTMQLPTAPILKSGSLTYTPSL